jgi:hypothetical protein
VLALLDPVLLGRVAVLEAAVVELALERLGIGLVRLESDGGLLLALGGRDLLVAG